MATPSPHPNWTIIATIATVIGLVVAVVGIFVAHIDASPSSTGPRSDSQPQVAEGAKQSGKPVSVAPPAPRPVLWSGPIRITKDGLDLGGSAPTSHGGAAFATIRYLPEKRTFSTGNSHPVALWPGATDPSYEQCTAQIGSQPLSSEESDAIPYQGGLAICVKTFSAQTLAFIRFTETPSTQSAPAFAQTWTMAA